MANYLEQSEEISENLAVPESFDIYFWATFRSIINI